LSFSAIHHLFPSPLAGEGQPARRRLGEGWGVRGSLCCISGKVTQRLAERLVERLVERLAESQKQILKLVQSNPNISKKELAFKIGISTTAIDKNISSLKKKGLLKRIGPDKGGYWEVSKK
jgi:predicted HTH transcriptional regulator